MKKKSKFNLQNISGYGFDYGIGITATAISSLEFNQNLIDADVMAVSYGSDYSKLLDTPVPAITLIGRNEQYLKQVFEEFSDWASLTDADAIEITFVFTKDGGYRLCISPEIRALYKRALQYDTVVNPTAFQVAWIKHMDTTSDYLKSIRRKLSRGIVRPFLLRAARYDGVLLSEKTLIPELVKPIHHEKELLKFEIRFVDEGSRDDSYWQYMALGKNFSGQDVKSVESSTPKPLVWAHRSSALKRLFPVTLWRSNSLNSCVQLRRFAEETGLFEWQIDQAICNLILSREISDGAFYFRNISKNDWPDCLWKALNERFEIANSNQQDFEQLNIEKIVNQAILDARTLLSHYGVKRVPKKLERVQYLLQKHSLHCELKDDLSSNR